MGITPLDEKLLNVLISKRLFENIFFILTLSQLLLAKKYSWKYLMLLLFKINARIQKNFTKTLFLTLY